MARHTTTWSTIGIWSFIAGMAVAILVALLALFGKGGIRPWVVVVLAILGLIVGLLNIGAGEVHLFLLASVAFVIASTSMAGIFATLGSGFNWLQTFMAAIAIFTAPATLVVAFKALYEVARSD